MATALPSVPGSTPRGHVRQQAQLPSVPGSTPRGHVRQQAQHPLTPQRSEITAPRVSQLARTTGSFRLSSEGLRRTVSTPGSSRGQRLSRSSRQTVPNQTIAEQSSSVVSRVLPPVVYAKGVEALETLSPKKPVAAKFVSKHLKEDMEEHGEICAICLEHLDGGDILFPCGRQHQLHCQCALHFLSSAMSRPDEKEKFVPPVPSLRSLGLGLRAIHALEEAMLSASPSLLMTRICCPLCRGGWNQSDMSQVKIFQVNSLISQLRALCSRKQKQGAARLGQVFLRILDPSHEDKMRPLRLRRAFFAISNLYHGASSFFACHIGGGRPTLTSILRHLNFDEVRIFCSLSRVCLDAWRVGFRKRIKQQAQSAERLGNVLSRANERLVRGEAVRLYRMKIAMSRLARNQHILSTFLASRNDDDQVVLTLLSHLRCRDVYRLSLVPPACAGSCLCGVRLRVPYITVQDVRIAVSHVSAPDVLSLDLVVHRSTTDWARGGKLNTEAAPALASWLSGSRALRELCLSNLEWETTDPGGVHLSRCVAGKALCVLDLTHNWLLDITVHRLAAALKSSSTRSLRILALDSNCFTELGFAALLPLGCGLGRVREWALKHNRLGNGGCYALSEVKPHPAAWDLRTNSIDANGCRGLVPALKTMTMARLGCNPLGDDGVSYLARGIGGALRVLDLRHGQFSDKGAVPLAHALDRAPMLRELLLADNDIRADGAGALTESCASLPMLCHLEFSNNPLGSSGVEAVAAQLPSLHQTPLRLSLIGVDCEAHGAQRLRTVLKAHPKHGRRWEIELHNNIGVGLGNALAIQRMLE